MIEQLAKLFNEDGTVYLSNNKVSVIIAISQSHFKNLNHEDFMDFTDFIFSTSGHIYSKPKFMEIRWFSPKSFKILEQFEPYLSSKKKNLINTILVMCT